VSFNGLAKFDWVMMVYLCLQAGAFNEHRLRRRKGK
jgi:hypothetical protein